MFFIFVKNAIGALRKSQISAVALYASLNSGKAHIRYTQINGALKKTSQHALSECEPLYLTSSALLVVFTIKDNIIFSFQADQSKIIMAFLKSTFICWYI